MERPVKRSYHAPLRKRQADSTRAQIVAAAAKTFSDNGYANARMEDVAQVAGVAVPTVYKTFKAKSALLLAALNAVMSETDSDAAIEEQPWWLEQLAARDGREQLMLIARNARAIYERAGRLLEVARTASTMDPEVDKVWRLINAQRLTRSHVTAESLSAKGALRPGITNGWAADTLFLLTGPELYILFLARKDAVPNHYEAWLGDLLSNALLQSP